MNNKLGIGEVAKLLDINFETLRRWDKNNILKAHRDTPTSHRYYFYDDIGNFLSNKFKYLYKTAIKWAFAQKPIDIPSNFYCVYSHIFKSRLETLSTLLQKKDDPNHLFALVISIIGEIGNNSFDHNMGNWPNIPGIFFSYNLKERKIVLIDRGQGILTTLKRVKPRLNNHKDALRVAFTEILSGREPEKRGNGLKYVRKIIKNNEQMHLQFQSGDAIVNINNTNDLVIKNTNNFMQGCFVMLEY